VSYPHKTVIVWAYPHMWFSLNKYPQKSEKGLGLPIYKIKPKINPEGFLSRLVGFIFILFQYHNKSVRTILPGTFCELDEVCAEVPEDSQVLRVRRPWFLTSDRFQTWLMPSRTTRSRQYHESTIVWCNLPPYHRFWYFVLSFSSKRGWQSGSKHYQRW